MKPNKTSWGKVAQWYDELLEKDSDSFQEKVILPNLLRIVDPKKGLKILDVACGQGYFSRAFHKKGASVSGCDISKELIQIAKENSSPEIEYFVAPSDNLKTVEPKSMDTVTIVLALQNIEKLSETFRECARVLKVGGRLVFVLNHPAFRIPKRSSWGWDEEDNKQYRRIDSYMSDSQFEIDMTPGERDTNKKEFTVSFHRPLQVFFKHLSKNGFVVTRLEEWISHRQSQPGPRANEEDRTRKEIPMFLCVEARV